MATAIHEIGHVVAVPQSTLAEDEYPQPVLAAMFSEEFAAKESAIASEPDYDDWPDHGPVWLRIVAHGVHRARRAGFELPHHGGQNHVPKMSSANMSLDDEFTLLANVPLADLAKFKPPADYEMTWRFSVDKWLARRPDDIFAKARARRLLSFFETDFHS